MTRSKIECYLCGEEGANLLTPDNSLDEILECRRCANRYRVTQVALRYYLKKEDKEILDPDDRLKLSEYVYDHIVLIDSKVIEKVTGKKSVGYK